MQKRGGRLVRELQEKLLSLGYEFTDDRSGLSELPKFGADGDFGSETVSAVTEFKQELVDLAEEEGVSTELQS